MYFNNISTHLYVWKSIPRLFKARWHKYSTRIKYSLEESVFLVWCANLTPWMWWSSPGIVPAWPHRQLTWRIDGGYWSRPTWPRHRVESARPSVAVASFATSSPGLVYTWARTCFVHLASCQLGQLKRNMSLLDESAQNERLLIIIKISLHYYHYYKYTTMYILFLKLLWSGIFIEILEWKRSIGAKP